MTVVSSKEFVTNQERYFDMAVDEQVYIKNGNNMFIVSIANDKKKNYLEPDDDFHRVEKRELPTMDSTFPFSAGLWSDYDIDDRTLRSKAWGTHNI